METKYKRRTIGSAVIVLVTALYISTSGQTQEPAAWVVNFVEPVVYLINRLAFILVFWFWHLLRKEKKQSVSYRGVKEGMSALDIIIISFLVVGIVNAAAFALQYILAIYLVIAGSIK